MIGSCYLINFRYLGGLSGSLKVKLRSGDNLLNAFNLKYLGVLYRSLKVKLHSGDNLLNVFNSRI